MWFKNCGKDYGEGVNCPECGAPGEKMPGLSWGRGELPGELTEKWPRDEKGELVRPVFLTHRSSLDLADEMTVGLLDSCGIPALRQYPNDGDFGRLILGVSGTGTDIYVPETMREEALLLIEGEVQ